MVTTRQQAKMSPAKRRRTEKDHPNDDLNLESTSVRKYELAQSPLSIFLTLRHIFSFLQPEELERCWDVNRCWRDVANPLIFRYYDVEIHGCKIKRPIILTKRALTNMTSEKPSSLGFENAIKTLEQLYRTNYQKLILSLKVNFDIDERHDNVEKFLKKIALLVEHLEFDGIQTVDVNVFSRFLLTRCPNLKTLYFSSLHLLGTLDSMPDSPEYKLKNLKKITFGTCIVSSQTLAKLLKIATNLEEIEKLPIWLIDAVEGRGEIVKSLAYQDDLQMDRFAEHGLTVRAAFQKLANLKPKLTSFSFLSSTFSFQGSAVEMIQSSVLSILKSSARSLVLFEIGGSDWFDFTTMPILHEVKTLVFEKPHLFNERCLPEDISPNEIFPNVEEIRYKFHLDQRNTIKWFFPELTSNSWGSQIKRLCVSHLDYISITGLRLMFPQVEDFEFAGSANEIAENFPELAQLRPPLKSLTINVTIKGDSKYTLTKHGILDCAFTGFSPKVVARLSDPLKRKTFSAAKIRGFKRRSTMSKFKSLERLTLKLHNNGNWCKSKEVYTTLTEVTSEFGFKCLPQLKVDVHVWKNNRTWKAIKTTLEPLARSSTNIEILEQNGNV